MDTASHFVIGVSLAGLSSIGHGSIQEPIVSQTILLGTLIGSQAPDFDGITKFFGGNTSYVKHHRGITHSIPAIFIWPTIIAAALTLLFSDTSYFSLWFWTFLSVLIHVSLDLLNAYGTQALRPFSNKWIALNIINIFDPFLFMVHISGILLWIISPNYTSYIFLTVYILTAGYIGWRTIAHAQLRKGLKEKYNLKGDLTLLPTINWRTWNIIEDSAKQVKVGVVRNKSLQWADVKKKVLDADIVQIAKKDKKAKAFLYFTHFVQSEYKKTSYGYEVRFYDLRYRFKDHYPFNVIILLDQHLDIINSYIGWTYNQSHKSKIVNKLLETRI